MTTPSPPPPSLRYARRHAWLESLYAQFHHRELITTDPLQVLYRFDAAADREVVGLIASSLAYGNVKAIMRGVEGVLGRMGASPHEYLLECDEARIHRDFREFRYRVTSGSQMAAMLVGTRGLLLQHGSLETAFLQCDQQEDTLIPGTGRFVDALSEYAGCDLRHLLPHPDRGSACKRLMLYLRWMVRRDEIDPGGWHRVDPARLVIPLDTHMHAMARRLRLTRRRDGSLRTALEITEVFRAISPADPLRYDFALTRPGIMRVQWPLRPCSENTSPSEGEVGEERAG